MYTAASEIHGTVDLVLVFKNFVELDGRKKYDGTELRISMKVKFEINKTFLKVTDVSTKVIILDDKRTIAISHIRSVVYYKD